MWWQLRSKRGLQVEKHMTRPAVPSWLDKNLCSKWDNYMWLFAPLHTAYLLHIHINSVSLSSLINTDLLYLCLETVLYHVTTVYLMWILFWNITRSRGPVMKIWCVQIKFLQRIVTGLYLGLYKVENISLPGAGSGGNCWSTILADQAN